MRATLCLYLFWLRWTRPPVYYRLRRYWLWQIIKIQTPFFMSLPRVTSADVIRSWRLDEES